MTQFIFFFTPRILCLMLLTLLFASACRPNQEKTDRVYQALFPEESLMFKHMEIGYSLDTIPLLEAIAPIRDDVLGMAFAYHLEDSTRLFIEYFTAARAEDSQVDAVLAHIGLSDEALADQLYQAIGARFKRLYGPAQGSYGSESWTGEVRAGPIEVFLNLKRDPGLLSVNFVRN